LPIEATARPEAHMVTVLTARPTLQQDRTLAGLRGRDLLSLRDFTANELTALLDLAARIKARPREFSGALRGQTLALLFEKPSLRTRVSFDVAMYQLGGHALYLGPEEVGLGRREAIRDVAGNLERLVQGIVVRTSGHDVVETLAAHAFVPVINGLTAFCHPCQALADVLTLHEFRGELDGLNLAYVGDGNNVATSLLFAGALLGLRVTVASPRGYEPPAEVVDWARANARRPGTRCEIVHDPVEAVAGADAVYTDTWVSMGQEAEAAERRPRFGPYQVNAALLAAARTDAVFMHCLPAHRGDEVTDEVIDGPRSVVFQQAENRLHAEKAVLVALMSGNGGARTTSA
jgi:ornithine carbamoyltransferase